MKSFAQLFKKYRLRSEFETIASFSDALAAKGYIYEESIFYHWQKGTRTPTHRDLVLTLIQIFKERDAIKTIDEANEFLSSVGLGYLTDNERKNLGLDKHLDPPFQVPHEIADFIGRKEIVRNIQKENIHGKTFLLYGSAGVGKTTLAIKLGHVLRQQFPDGILWYRIDMVKIEDVFLSIAHLLGEELPKSKNREITASFIRSILARKKVLLLFDNVEKDSDIHLFLPLGSSSSLIISSRHKDLYLPTSVTALSLESFSEEEVLGLFKNIFDTEYVRQHKKMLLRLGTIVGNLPLAVHLLASQLKQSGKAPEYLFEQRENKVVSLQNLPYENKNLSLALEVSYANLSAKARAVFLSIGVFEGKDFSAAAIGYMNGLTVDKTRNILDELCNASLIEFSLHNKFRIHPMIRRFIAEKINNPYFVKIFQVTFALFGFFTLFWILIHIEKLSHNFNSAFSNSYFVISLWGSLWGLSIARKWGMLKRL